MEWNIRYEFVVHLVLRIPAAHQGLDMTNTGQPDCPPAQTSQASMKDFVYAKDLRAPGWTEETSSFACGKNDAFEKCLSVLFYL